MPRLSADKHLELELFWKGHLQAWMESDLNQREYCELNGLPLKRFGNWRAKFKHEFRNKKRGLLYRRGGLNHVVSHVAAAPSNHRNEDLEHRLKHMSNGAKQNRPDTVPSARSLQDRKRRNFSEAQKRRIVCEASYPGASISGVARKYGIGRRLLFQWKKDLTPSGQDRPNILPVTVSDASDGADHACLNLPKPAPSTLIVERGCPGIEVELVGGRRVRFEKGTDPETMRQLISLLEGETP